MFDLTQDLLIRLKVDLFLADLIPSGNADQSLDDW